MAYLGIQRGTFIEIASQNVERLFAVGSKLIDCNGILDRMSQLNHSPMSNTSAAIEAESTRSIANFLRNLFRLLDESGIRYCVLHSWELLPEQLPSDLDMVVDPADTRRLFPVFEQLDRLGYRPIGLVNYSTNAYRFDFGWFEGRCLVTAGVDVICEDRRSGLLIGGGAEMIRGREKFRQFWVASPEIEFRHVLAKNASRQTILPRHAARLRDLANQIGTAQAEHIAGKFFFRRRTKRDAADYMNSSFADALSGARDGFWKKALLSHPLRFARYSFEECSRLIRRWFQPAGLFVAVLGPDGVGKSTLIDGITDTFSRVLRSNQNYHWRPGFLGWKKRPAEITNPHGQPPRGTLASMLHLTFFFVDYWLGYFFDIRVRIARFSFVMFDRYFHDVLVDPKRYRYGGPKWYANLLSRWVPEPDIVIRLDADEQLIFSRKPELLPDEIRRQRLEYDRLCFRRAQKVTIRTDSDIESSVHASIQALVDFMRHRFQAQTCDWRTVAQ
jgi:thymidylate kinase